MTLRRKQTKPPFLRQHFLRLCFAPAMLGRKHASPEDIEEAVHLASDALVKKPDGMMQPGGEFDRHPASHRLNERPRDLRPGRKRIRGHPAGAEFESRRRCPEAPRSSTEAASAGASQKTFNARSPRMARATPNESSTGPGGNGISNCSIATTPCARRSIP